MASGGGKFIALVEGFREIKVNVRLVGIHVQRFFPGIHGLIRMPKRAASKP